MRLFLLLAASALAADFPSAQIRNQVVTAKFYLPDAERGYYRGTRFDWSGVTYSLQAGGHEYFGQWFPKYDPKLHDAIMGPVEEFRTEDGGLGYALAKPGETFIRIGVGVVRRPDDKPYQNFQTYEIVDAGRWRVKTAKDRIRFTQDLKGPNGYAYRYTKTMRLEGDEARLIIEHELKNTGTRAIEAQQYNHNFFVIDGETTGPATWVKFPFDLKAVRPFRNKLAEVRGGEIHYLEAIPAGQSVSGEFQGTESASGYDIRVENRKAQAGVRIRGDRPIAKIIYWSIRSVFSPEPYVAVAAAPGKTTRWTYTYDFYALKQLK